MKKIIIYILQISIPVILTIIGTQVVDRSIPMRYELISSDQQFLENFETTGIIIHNVKIENKRNIPLNDILIETNNNIIEVSSNDPYFNNESDRYSIKLLPVNSEIVIIVKSTKENIYNDLQIISAYGVAKGKVKFSIFEIYQIMILLSIPLLLITFLKQKEKLQNQIINKNEIIKESNLSSDKSKIFQKNVVIKLGEKKNLKINNKIIPITIKSIATEDNNPVVELKIDSGDVYIDPGSKYEYVKFQYYKYKEGTYPTWKSKIIILENHNATDDYFVVQIDIDHINEIENEVHLNVSSLEFINEGRICLTKT